MFVLSLQQSTTHTHDSKNLKWGVVLSFLTDPKQKSLTFKPCKKCSLQAVCFPVWIQTAGSVLNAPNFSPPNLSLVAVSFCYMTTCPPSFSQAGDFALKRSILDMYCKVLINATATVSTLYKLRPLKCLNNLFSYSIMLLQRSLSEWNEVWTVFITSMVLREET